MAGSWGAWSSRLGRHRRVLLYPGHSGLSGGRLDLPPGARASPGPGCAPAPAEGRRVPAGHVRPPLLPPWRSLRRRVCRCARPAPGPEGADGRGWPGRTAEPRHDSSPSWRPLLWGVAVLVGVAILGGVAYPGLVQRYRVSPNEIVKEKPYIDFNIRYTRLAYGLDNIEEREFPAEETLTLQDLRTERGDPQEYPPLGHPAPAGHVQPAPGDPDLLQVHRYRYRSIPINGEYRQVTLSPRGSSPQGICRAGSGSTSG